MQLEVMSKKKMYDLLEMNNFLNNPKKIDDENIAIISIIDPGKDRLIEENSENVLVLEFPDVSDPNVLNGFNQEHEVLKFIERHKDKDMFFVHCTMGVSRSGGIGLFIRDYYLNEYDRMVFDRFHRHLVPNSLVYRRLLDAYHYGKETIPPDESVITKREKKTLKKLKKQNLI